MPHYYQLMLSCDQKGKSQHRVRACDVSAIAIISTVLDTAQKLCATKLQPMSTADSTPPLDFGIVAYFNIRVVSEWRQCNLEIAHIVVSLRTSAKEWKLFHSLRLCLRLHYSTSYALVLEFAFVSQV